MRALIPLPVGARTGEGPVLALVSEGGWSADGAAGTRYKTSKALYRPLQVPAANQTLALCWGMDSTLKITVRGKCMS